jgi:hypothetical protein
VLSLADLDPPATPGGYQWRAIVTPRRADATLNPTAAYELHATFPVPHVVTLRGRYLPATHQALLNGTLRARGKPQPHAFVQLTQLNRTITPHGPLFRDTTAALTQTRRDPTYSITVPLHATRGFLASSPRTITACTQPSPAVAHCRTTTTSGTEHVLLRYRPDRLPIPVGCASFPSRPGSGAVAGKQLLRRRHLSTAAEHGHAWSAHRDQDLLHWIHGRTVSACLRADYPSGHREPAADSTRPCLSGR